MPDLKEQLRTDLTTAMKSRDELRTATLRMALAAVSAEEVAGKEARTLSDDEVEGVLRREAKKRREAAEAFAGAGRTEQAERERAEGDVLAGYLPAQMEDADLAALVADVITQTGASGMKDMGKVMGAANGVVAGRAEGSSTFHVLWNEVNSASPSTVTASARRTASACAGPDVEIPTRTPRARNPASARCTAASSSTPLSSVAECTW